MVILQFVALTANVLGIFYDPFEFQGDYGSEVNPTRQRVFEQVVSQEALAKGLTDAKIAQMMHKAEVSEAQAAIFRSILVHSGRVKDQHHGPTLAKLVPPKLIQEIAQKQQELEHAGFTHDILDKIQHFLHRYSSQKVFHLLRNVPSGFLSLDKFLKDQASQEGRAYDLPILGSTQLLSGRNAEKLKTDLLHKLFTEEAIKVAKPEDSLRKSLAALDDGYMASFLGEGADNSDLDVFCTRAGQVFFYWMYESLNLHLVSCDADAIESINRVKEIFSRTLGNPQARAESLKEKLLAADAGVLFTQESDAYVPQELLRDGLFLPVDKQNANDGTLIFLRSDMWEADYEVLPLENYADFAKGRINIVLATSKLSGHKFLLVSAHGNSTNPADGRLQVALAKETFDQLRQEPENEGLQLLIGIDANTKSEEDVAALREHLDNLGLTATSVGPTTVKQRMLTAQHSKVGRYAVDEEDFLIVLKPEEGGAYRLAHQTVGFKEALADPTVPLPNIDNQSDHYPVGAAISLDK